MQAGRRLPVLTALLLVSLLALACDPASSTSIAAQGLTTQADGWRGLPLEAERSLPAVTFEEISGEPFDLAGDLRGTPSLVFFGYTSCPDFCPAHLAAIASAMSLSRVSYDDLQVVFVSVDPERDTPERIEDYLGYFDARMIGLRAPLDVVQEALDALDLPGPVIDGTNPRDGGALIAHPAQVIGFDADGQAQRTWPFGVRRSDWVTDLPRIVEEWS